MINAFDEDDVAVAHLLARHATVAIGAARPDENLTIDLGADRAFAVLRRYSQQHNRKLRDVAQELIDTRRLPR